LAEPHITNKSTLRNSLRKKRAHAASQQFSEATLFLSRFLNNLRVYRMAKNIGIYLPTQSEFPVFPIIEKNLVMNKVTYAPEISSIRNKTMCFTRLSRPLKKHLIKKNSLNKNLRRNAYGIEESIEKNEIINPKALDIVFTPLLGFNKNGERLGMGGGYYDRLFSFKRWRSTPTKPMLIGLAYEAQFHHSITVDPWDVPMDAIITEQNFYAYKRALL